MSSDLYVVVSVRSKLGHVVPNFVVKHIFVYPVCNLDVLGKNVLLIPKYLEDESLEFGSAIDRALHVKK